MSRVAVGGPACTRFPSVTSARLTRPLIGERTSVHSRLSRAVATVRLRRPHRGLALGLAGGARIVLLLGDRLDRDQPPGPVHIPRRQLGAGPGDLDLGLRPRQLGGVRPGIDLEEDLALADFLSFLEGHPADEARDPRADFHRVHRLEPAGELVPLVDLALGHRGDGDGRRGRGGGEVTAAGYDKTSEEDRRDQQRP